MTVFGYVREMSDSGYNLEDIGLFHRTMLPFLVRRLGLTTSSRIVDIGAGSGHGLLPLWLEGFRNLVAVDRDAFNFARLAEQFGIPAIHCDIEQDAVALEDNSVDLVISFHVIEHLVSPHNLMREVYRILRQGGIFALVTPDWRKQYRTFYRDPTHVRPYDHESIVRLLKMYGYGDVFSTPWGSRWGLGRLRAYRFFPRLGLIGNDLFAQGRKR
jgi:SAM-dependent methyltransferase